MAGETKNRNIFLRIHDKLKFVFHDSKFGQFWSKAHLQYLVLAFLMYGFKAVLYFIIAYIPCNPAYFGDPNVAVAIGYDGSAFSGVYSMWIDEAIPFVSYFYFFYFLYYIVPEFMLWILSFFDKKKMCTIVVSTMATTVIACICFVIQQVKMIRPVEVYDATKGIYNLDTLFRWGVNWQYHADETALNCLPSLHATVGMALAMAGLWTGKDDKHFPIGLRIFCAIFGFGIVASTLFVKQHYFIDAVTGAGLMAIFYFIFKLWIVPPFLRKREAKIKKLEEVKAAE